MEAAKGADRPEEKRSARRAVKTRAKRATTNPSAFTNPSPIEDHQRKLTGDCPLGHQGKLFADLHPNGRRWRVGCWVCCPPGASDEEAREFLEYLKDVTNARGDQILANAPRYLEPFLNMQRVPSRQRFAPLSYPSVAGWHSGLLGRAEPFDYLLARGLTPETIEKYELGHDRDENAITIPVRDEAGELINLRRRFLDPETRPKIIGLPNHPAALYPVDVLAHGFGPFVLCEGEFDALLLNQHGIKAVTSTAGTTGWAKHPEWNQHIRSRHVAVLYDAGASSYERAERRARAFMAAGAREAWPVDLTLCGFAEEEDATDWFVRYGWSANELRVFLNRSLRWYRAEQETA